MNTEEHIDKLFREGLHSGQKEPPPHLWNNISDSLKGAPVSRNGHRRSGRKLLWWSGSALIIALISTGVLLHILSGNSVNENGSLTHQKTGYHLNGGDDDILIETAEINNTYHQKKTKESPVLTSKEKNKIAIDKSVNNHYVEPAYRQDHSRESADLTEPAAVIKTQDPAQKIAPQQEHALPEPKEMPMETAVELTIDITMESTIEITVESADESAAISAESQADLQDPEIVEVQEAVSAEMHQKRQKPFAREMMFGISMHTGSQLYRAVAPYPSDFRFGPEGMISGNLQYKRFNLKTGVGMSNHTDRNSWQTTVLKLDTVSYYQKVTGVSFIPVYDPTDSMITGYVPGNFSTVNYPIIDSSEEVISHNVKNRYTFFSVPLIAGYDIYHGSHLTLGFHAGMIYNKRVYERRPLPEISQEKVIFSMEDFGLIRREHFLQYHSGLYARYDINLKWYAEGAVAVRRPVGSWYDHASLQGKPVSLMLSAGLGFWL